MKIGILIGGGVLIMFSGPLGLAVETIATAVLTAIQPIGYRCNCNTRSFYYF
ncbi:MAG: hypothetical protein ACP5PQ_03305 [Thermoproteota archaeon]